MANIVQRTFLANDTITIPSGVKFVSVTPVYENCNETISNYLFTASWISNFGNIYAMGQNPSGNLGTGDIIPRSSPTLISSSLRFNKFITNMGASFGLAENGVLYSWGSNSFGQLGVGDLVPRSAPTVVSGNISFVDIKTALPYVSTFYSIYGLSANGSVYTWPIDLRTSAFNSVTTPTQLTSNIKATRMLVGGLYNCIVSDSSNNAYSFGNNSSGELGIGSVTFASSATAISGGYKFSKIYQLGTTVGGTTMYGLTTTGQLYAWGSNYLGALGIGSAANAVSSPVLVMSNIKDIFKQQTYSLNPFVIDNDGKLYSWGQNQVGQLGLNDLVTRSTPTLITLPTSSKLKKVIANGNSTGADATTLFLMEDGTLYSVGSNTYGLLGTSTNPATTAYRSSPTLVSAGVKFVDVYSAPYAFYAVTQDNQMYSWGYNISGRLGINAITDVSTPFIMAGSCNFKTVPSFTQGQQGGKIIEVIPNTTYNIYINSSGCFFGTEPVGQGPIEKLIVTYTQ